VNIAGRPLGGRTNATTNNKPGGHLRAPRSRLLLICMGGRTVGPAVALDLVQTFLTAEFSQTERHLRRLSKVTSLEAVQGGQ
jgi:ribose 5-phosphate isomerase B